MPTAAATAAGLEAPDFAAERSTALKRAPLPNLAFTIHHPYATIAHVPDELSVASADVITNLDPLVIVV